MFDEQSLSYSAAIRFLQKECRSRPITPFLGAGVSLASGFPAISAIVEYLAKVDFAIENEVYAHRYPRIQLGVKSVAVEYKEHPSRFLRDFGWPGLGQLDADLWEWLERTHSPENPPKELDLGRHGLWNQDADQLRASNLDKQSEALSDLLSHDICHITHGKIIDGVVAEKKNESCLDLRDHLRAIVQWALRRDLRLRESGTTRAVMNEWTSWKNWYLGIGRLHEPELLYGDWESLLDRLCEGDFNLVDTLFTSLEGGRLPTTAHRFMTFLHATIEIPIILTTNFESLLEKAFKDAGRSPKVFDIHKDADLPDSDLVRREFSILKLHGSSYGLRLGERLRTPIEYDAQADVIRYLPESALILVIGFSGSERRIMQLLHAIATSSSSRHEVRILWLKGPGSLSVPLSQLLKECKNAIKICEISDAGAFLEDLYFAYSQGYRSSKVSYTALGGRPIVAKTEPGSYFDFDLSEDSKTKRKKLRRPVQLLFRKIDSITPHASNSATLAAAEFCDYLGYRYHQIWIDLESHHTVSGVVDDLFNNFRRFDPESPYVAIADTVDGAVSQEVLIKVVDRIGEVLGRGRYVVVFDSLDSFGRTQMMHHGVPTYELLKVIAPDAYETLTKDFATRVSALKDFLEMLLLGAQHEKTDKTKFFRDSYVVVTADKERSRQPTENSGNSETLREMKKVMDFFRSKNHTDAQHIHRRILNPKKSRLEDLAEHWRQYDPIHKNVTARIASIVQLKRTIAREDLSSKIEEQTTNTVTDDAEITNDALTALVAILSVFRRPRSMAMVRSLTERWILPEKGYLPVKTTVNNANIVVNEFLKQLETGEHILIHQGGRVRIDRLTHENLYSNLTKALHIGTVILQWKSNYAEDTNKRAGLILEALLVSSLHFAAARTMYVDVFLPTKDVHAFYEYTYHRVSVLRILTVAHGLLRMPGVDEKSFSASIEHLMGETLELSGATLDKRQGVAVWFLNSIGMTGVVLPNLGNSGVTVSDLANYIQDLRLHALQTLSLAVRRSATLLRSVASPETLLSWARQFDRREKADISGDVFVNAYSESPGLFGDNVDEKQISDAVQLRQEARNALNETEQVFRKLAAWSSFAKLDFLSVIEDQLDITGVDSKTFVKRAINVRERVLAKFDSEDYEFADSPEAALEFVQKRIMPLRALSHIGWYDISNLQISHMKRLVLSVSKVESSELAFQARVLLRDITELELKTLLGKNFHPWHSLDHGWRFEITSSEDNELLGHGQSPLNKGTQNKNNSKCIALREAETLAVEYETLLRETSKTPNEDARHRSSAYLLRSRALYLQGQFRTAHRYLDLAACGTSEVSDEKGVGQASIHLARAELLVYSADIHLTKFDESVIYDDPRYVLGRKRAKLTKDMELNEIAKEWNKLKRADEEIAQCNDLLTSSRHQTIWALRTHMGSAQISFEGLLARLENFARRESVIGASVFARYSGELERAVVTGMKHLRSALDILPFISEDWIDVANISEDWIDVAKPSIAICPCVLDERRIYALWMHFYVVSKFFWSVLHMWHTAPRSYAEVDASRLTTVDEIVTRVNGNRAREGDETWRMWCSSLRFRNFATLPLHNWMRDAIDGESISGNSRSSKYSVAPIRRVILSICKEISNDKTLNVMWDRRRSSKK